MDTRDTRVFESRQTQKMNRVSSTPNEYAKYVNTQDEIDVPEYFNLPNLIRVSKGHKISLPARDRVTYFKVITQMTLIDWLLQIWVLLG